MPSMIVVKPRAWVIMCCIVEGKLRRTTSPREVPKIIVRTLIQVPLVLAHRLSIEFTGSNFCIIGWLMEAVGLEPLNGRSSVDQGWHPTGVLAKVMYEYI
jgi:hypothetical protein